MHHSNIWSSLLQPLVRKDSHIPSYPHFSIPIFSLGKLPSCTDNMPYCFSGVTTKSAYWCLRGLIISMLCLTKFAPKACSQAVRISSVPFFCYKITPELSPELLYSHLKFAEQTLNIGLFHPGSWLPPLSSGSPEGSFLQQAPSPLKPFAASSLCSLSGSHTRICTHSLQLLNANEPSPSSFLYG